MSLDNPICIFCEENVRAWDDDVLNVEIDEPGAPTAPARLHHFVAFCGGRFVAADQKFAAAAAFWVSVPVPVPAPGPVPVPVPVPGPGAVPVPVRSSWLLIRHRAARLVGGTEPAP